MYRDPDDLAEWYFIDQDRPSGPVSKSDLLRLVADHKLDVDCLVWRQGLRDWLPFYQSELMAPLPFQSELMAPAPPPEDWRNALAVPHNAWRNALGALGQSQAIQTLDEDAIYRRRSVVVSSQAARFGDATYPISAITGVRIKSARRVEWAIAGLVSIGAGVVSIFYNSPAGIAGFVLGTLLLGVALNSKHKLILRTAMGEQRVHAAYRKSELREIMRAIEYALTTPSWQS